MVRSLSRQHIKACNFIFTVIQYIDLQQSVAMAEKLVSEWDEILKGKWSAYDVEKSLYLDSVKKTSAPDVRAKIICDGLRNGDVPDNLKKLYVEAVYGSDPKVRSRILSRVYFIGGKVR